MEKRAATTTERAGTPPEYANEVDERLGGLMVCVTGRHSCEKLLSRGARRRKPGQKLYCVHCVQLGETFLNNDYEPLAIEFLFSCASLYDAELTILRADNVIDALVEFAKTNHVAQIVLGPSPVQGPDSFSAKLSARLSDVEFIIAD